MCVMVMGTGPGGLCREGLTGKKGEVLCGLFLCHAKGCGGGGRGVGGGGGVAVGGGGGGGGVGGGGGCAHVLVCGGVGVAVAFSGSVFCAEGPPRLWLGCGSPHGA